MGLKDSDKPKKKKIYKQVFISPDRNYKRKYVGYDDGSEKSKETRTVRGMIKGVPKKNPLSRPQMDPDKLEQLLTPVQPSNELTMKKKGGAVDKKWIQKAVNPKHKGYCTPMSKPTCTPKRKALARTFKKMAKNK
jgi:hypothetical protein